MQRPKETASTLIVPARGRSRVARQIGLSTRTSQRFFSPSDALLRDWKRLIYSCLLVIGIGAQSASGDTLDIQRDRALSGFIANVEFLVDENNDLTLDQIVGSHQNRFTSLKRGLLITGFSDTRVWIRLNTHNLDMMPTELVVAFNTHPAATITAYDSQTGLMRSTGPLVANNQRPMGSITPAIPMTIPPGSSSHLFSASSLEPMQISMSVLGKQRFAQLEYQKVLKALAFSVPLAVFSILCLVVGLARKQDATIIIAGIGLAILTNEIAQSGLLSPIIDIPNINLTVRDASGLVTSFFLILMTRETLKPDTFLTKRLVPILASIVALAAIYALTSTSVAYSHILLSSALIVNSVTAFTIMMLGKKGVHWIQFGMVGILAHELTALMFLLGYFDSYVAVTFYATLLYVCAFVSFSLYPVTAATQFRLAPTNTDPEGILAHILSKIRADIQLPTSGIIEMSELLSETNLSVKQREYLSTMRLSGIELMQKSREINALYRLYGPTGIGDPEPILLHEFLQDIVKKAYQEAAFKGVELILDIKSNVPVQVTLHKEVLDIIVSSLLRNAIRFTVYGDVLLTVSLDDNHKTRFRITDTGSGIDGEQLKSLFQFQKNSRKQTSITLPLCSRLVNRIGGRLGVSSQVGVGTTFWFSLMFEKNTTKSIQKSKPTQLLQGVKMLVADENKNSRRVVSHIAEHFGIRVDTCSSGPETMALLQTKAQLGHNYDFLLIDQNMPQMTAQQVVNRIQENRNLREGLTIIMMHAQANTMDAEHFTALGFDALLQKPVSSQLLYNTLIGFLPQYRTDHL